MASLPKNIRQAWQDREGAAILATVSEDGVPNLAYVSLFELSGDDAVAVADCTFGKTRRNLLHGGKGALLFRDRQGKTYQLKGTTAYHQSGPAFERMRGRKDLPGPLHGVVILTVEEAYSGSSPY